MYKILTKSYLKDVHLNKKQTLVTICKNVGCSDVTLRRYLKKFKIPVSHGKNHELRKKLTKSYLFRMYWENNYSTCRIGRICKCKADTVLKYLKKFDIPIKSRGWKHKRKKLTKAHRLKLAKAHKGKKLTQAHKDAIKNSMCIHHIDCNHGNDEKTNLIRVKNRTHQLMCKIYYNFIETINQGEALKEWLKINYTNK